MFCRKHSGLGFGALCDVTYSETHRYVIPANTLRRDKRSIDRLKTLTIQNTTHGYHLVSMNVLCCLLFSLLIYQYHYGSYTDILPKGNVYNLQSVIYNLLDVSIIFFLVMNHLVCDLSPFSI